MIESRLQQKIVTLCKQNSILTYKINADAQRGIPDLLLIAPCGTVLLFEIKTQTGRVSALQERMHKKMKQNNANVFVIRSVEEAILAIDSVVN